MKICSAHFARIFSASLSLVLVVSSSCIKRQREATSANDLATASAPRVASANEALAPPRININTASASELETLPGIGKALAERIIEHREKYGPFRRPAHLIMVRGMSDKRYRALRELVMVE